ncbi:transmembrane protein adipocyte-associated 1 homolog [Anneissia japonica]|uniref:transmembrane protein adipocyte-associated 1 homolog n=1 Tax=Anneissia japonica TaxID=1529436 RepID=UPI001425B34F|nr:transmembrane protein adipocyte-associated 1 homolog [Anneissia japonica]
MTGGDVLLEMSLTGSVNPVTQSTVMQTTNQMTTMSTMTTGNASDINNIQHCLLVLYSSIGDSQIRYWDLALLIPNMLFLIFLIVKAKAAIVKLRQTTSPIFVTFYITVFTIAVISVVRGVVSMMVASSTRAGDIVDTALWLILKFFLLGAELSVLTFGLAFGHLDSNSSIKRVLLVTAFISLAYSTSQGVLEVRYPDSHFDNDNPKVEFDVFAHGGTIFFFTSSLVFFLIYSVVLILPCTRLRNSIQLPSKRSFYYYCTCLSVLNGIQAIGCAILHYNITQGLCIIDVTSYLYFTCFAPLVYLTFLHNFLRSPQPALLFSYKPQIDEVDDETHTFPRTITRVAESPINIMYESTEFAGHSNPNSYLSDQTYSLNAGTEKQSPDA